MQGQLEEQSNYSPSRFISSTSFKMPRSEQEKLSLSLSNKIKNRMPSVHITRTKTTIPAIYTPIITLLSFKAPRSPITPKIIPKTPRLKRIHITTVPALAKSLVGKISSKLKNSKSSTINAIPPRKIMLEKRETHIFAQR